MCSNFLTSVLRQNFRNFKEKRLKKKLAQQIRQRNLGYSLRQKPQITFNGKD